ncbi:MAG: UDP-N-acetylmuramate dehydrogenase [Thermodesulfovibrionales bacterium]|nr:UDP-N-acetylmuramate dehydrogenase [Thermodesulfovibrionales bacterium]
MRDEQFRAIFSEGFFEGEVRFMEPMSNHTSLRIGGAAEIFALPRDLDSLKNIHLNLKKSNIPYIALGSGTNILIRDGGIAGAVVLFRSLKKIETLREEDEFIFIHTDAGALLAKLVRFSQEHGFSGLEGLAGIPGTVGGAICGNSGAFGYEIKDVLVALEMMDREGIVSWRRAEDIAFGYRKSGIRPEEFILGAEIRLKKDHAEAVSKRIGEFLRTKRERQPIWEPSAGCVFKNPPGTSAGKLLDEAGCKGATIGEVEVSEVHANFFVNKGNANALDFIRLMELVSLRVEKRFGILLEAEIKILGREIAD